MSKNAIQNGLVLSLIAAAAGVVSGTPLLVGALFVVPSTDAAEDEPYEAHTVGVWEFPKVPADAPTAGAPAYWDESAGQISITDDTAANKFIGVYTEDRANGDTSCYVRLNGRHFKILI